MPLRLGPLRIPWPGSRNDPYWDSFIHTPPADPNNLVPEAIRRATGGAINPTKADLHSPEITSSHIKQLAHFLGAESVGIVQLSDGPNGPHPTSSDELETYPFAIVCAVRADYDPKQALGIGGQVPLQNGQFVSYVLASYIRELGYRATMQVPAEEVRLAVVAGLGTLNAKGRLVTRQHGAQVHVADVVHTDLPLAPDGVA